MGIPSYFSYIIRNHPRIIQVYEKNKLPINNFYLDCNSIIYDSVSKIDFTKMSSSCDKDKIIIGSVIKKLDEYIELICPLNKIFIAFDGVAPLAKIEQQRERRFKMQATSTSTSTSWNTISITPGTIFMRLLTNQITEYYASNSKVIVSGSDKAGEGEHKIYEWLRKNTIKGEKSLVYGLDADLIMLSINHLKYGEIYLFRETPHFIQSINANLKPFHNYVLNIPLLCESMSILPADYIFICFFAGNDFMPHFPSLNIRTGGINKLLKAYEETNRVLINQADNTINWTNVGYFILELSKRENEYIVKEHKMREKPFHQEDKDEDPMLFIPMRERQVEKYINPLKLFWENRYYMALHDIDYGEDKDKNKVNDLCMNFLEGLEWCFRYYSGECPDWRWKYKARYPPLLRDIVTYMSETIVENNFVKREPVSDITQLSYVLPFSSLYLLPEKFSKVLKERKEWYPQTNKPIDELYVWAYCRYFWEAHAILPEIDIDELEQMLSV